MKKLFALVVLNLLLLAVVPSVLAVSVGTGVDVDISTEKFAPRVWLCGSRIVTDDNIEYGRVSEPGDKLIERINNYAFEGEQISWIVLVMDKNGIEKVGDVYATVGDDQGVGNDIEVNCRRIGPNAFPRNLESEGFPNRVISFESCNARIDEEVLTGVDPATMSYYECTLTVETPESMYGEYWVTVEAIDLDGLTGTMDENEYWFFNPVVALSVRGTLAFDNVRPGSSAYSKTLTVGNDADEGSGVMLDMFISGTDFYDSSSSGAMCPTTNQLSLSNFRYFATNGAYSTLNDWAVGGRGPGAADNRNKDVEGYVNIGYGNGFNNPVPFYDGYEIIQQQKQGPYWVANLLAPGAEMSLTFKLDLPVPCNGDFDAGSIYFWGEAI